MVILSLQGVKALITLPYIWCLINVISSYDFTSSWILWFSMVSFIFAKWSIYVTWAPAETQETSLFLSRY